MLVRLMLVVMMFMIMMRMHVVVDDDDNNNNIDDDFLLLYSTLNYDGYILDYFQIELEKIENLSNQKRRVKKYIKVNI